MNAIFSPQGMIAIAIAVASGIVWFVVQRRSKKSMPKAGKKQAQPTVNEVKAQTKPVPDRRAVMIALQDRTLSEAERAKLKGMLLAEVEPSASVATAVAEPMPKLPAIPPGAILANGHEGKFKAVVFSEHGEYNIDFKRIPVPLGNVVQLEPSMPSKGGHYMVLEKATPDGTLYWEPYDPRFEEVDNKKTPQRAYWAVHVYELVSAIWANKYGMWEKVNTILAALMGGGMLIVAIVALDKLGK